MKLLRRRKNAPIYVVLLALVAVSGVGYAMATAEENRADVVISEEQKTEFIEYVKGKKIQPSSLTARVSVGDTLPDTGITYYVLPLGYGYPFYRYACVGTQIVIVDRFSGAVVQVLDRTRRGSARTV